MAEETGEAECEPSPRLTYLFENAAKSKRPPYMRLSHGNKTMPSEIWTDTNEALKKMRNEPVPRAWDRVICPKLVRLFKAGIIGPCYYPYPIGQAVVADVTSATESDNKHAEMFLEYRSVRSDRPSMAEHNPRSQHHRPPPPCPPLHFLTPKSPLLSPPNLDALPLPARHARPRKSRYLVLLRRPGPELGVGIRDARFTRERVEHAEEC